MNHRLIALLLLLPSLSFGQLNVTKIMQTNEITNIGVEPFTTIAFHQGDRIEYSIYLYKGVDPVDLTSTGNLSVVWYAEIPPAYTSFYFAITGSVQVATSGYAKVIATSDKTVLPVATNYRSTVILYETWGSTVTSVTTLAQSTMEIKQSPYPNLANISSIPLGAVLNSVTANYVVALIAFSGDGTLITNVNAATIDSIEGASIALISSMQASFSNTLTRVAVPLSNTASGIRNQFAYTNRSGVSEFYLYETNWSIWSGSNSWVR